MQDNSNSTGKGNSSNQSNTKPKRNTRNRASSSSEDDVPAKKRKSKKRSSNKKENEAPNSKGLKKQITSCNFLKYYKNHEMGFSCQKYRKPLKDSVINFCKTFQIHKIESPFDRRVTCIVWHPTNPKQVAVASHWGDVILYDYDKDVTKAPFIQGIGPGGSIQGMKFDPLNPVQIYTASMEGKFLVMNFETKKAKQFLVTNDINRWYISVDVNSSNNIMVAGDTKGNLSILTLQGEIIADQLQLHKKGFKVSHTEFSKSQPWLLCTSSTDSTMKLWDIRSLRGEKSGMAVPLQTITHEKPINAAYFSLTNGCRLMTTDQKDKICIYRAPLWDLETVIRHPHRQFQHLTPIRAYWHPLEDIVFVGRYPHSEFPGYQENELRTIDFFDADSGDLLYQHYQTGCNGILSLNRFNMTGDALASSYGARFIIWKPNFKALEKLSKKQDSLYRSEGRENKDSKDDSDDVDWEAFLKKQTKEKQASKGKVKVQTKVQTQTQQNNEDDGDED